MLKVSIPTHVKSYNFDRIAERYGASFTRRLMEVWITPSGVAGYAGASAYSVYIALRDLLLWISESDDSFYRSVFSALLQERQPTQIEWHRALLEYRAFVAERNDLRCSTKASRIGYINCSVDFLMRCGAVPDSPPLEHPRGARAAKTSRLSLAFLTRSGVQQERGSDLDIILQDEGVSASDLTLGAKIKLVEALNESRLSELMAVSERSSVSCYDDFVKGERLLAMSTPYDQSDVVASLCSMSDDVFLSSVLKSITACQERFCWKLWFEQQSKAVRSRLSNLGGRYLVGRLLGGTVDGAVALETILLCETGLNVAVVEALFYDFTSKAVAGRRRVSTIAAAKLRANGNVVEGDLVRDKEAWLPVGRAGRLVSGVRAIEMWLTMTEAMRARADHRTAEYLFLIPSGCNWDGDVRPARTARGPMADAWQRLLGNNRENPVIGGLPIQRASIRPSVAQVIDARMDFDTLSAKIWLNHSRFGVTWTYLNVPWMRRELDRQIRRFQQLLESALASGLPEIARELGTSYEELAQRKHLAEETGLGTLCLDAYSGIQPGTQRGQLCDRLDRCASGCRLMRFVPTESSLQALAAFNRALRRAEDAWVRSRPERWVEAWLPWLALTEAILRTLQRSPVYRKKLAAALRATDEALERGEIFPFEPY